MKRRVFINLIVIQFLLVVLPYELSARVRNSARIQQYGADIYSVDSISSKSSKTNLEKGRELAVQYLDQAIDSTELGERRVLMQIRKKLINAKIVVRPRGPIARARCKKSGGATAHANPFRNRITFCNPVDTVDNKLVRDFLHEGTHLAGLRYPRFIMSRNYEVKTEDMAKRIINLANILVRPINATDRTSLAKVYQPERLGEQTLIKNIQWPESVNTIRKVKQNVQWVEGPRYIRSVGGTATQIRSQRAATPNNRIYRGW